MVRRDQKAQWGQQVHKERKAPQVRRATLATPALKAPRVILVQRDHRARTALKARRAFKVIPAPLDPRVTPATLGHKARKEQRAMQATLARKVQQVQMAKMPFWDLCCPAWANPLMAKSSSSQWLLTPLPRTLRPVQPSQ